MYTMGERYVYVGMVISLAISAVGFPSTGERFVLRPSWCPPFVLMLIVHMGKWIPAAAALALSSAAAFPDFFVPRAAAAALFSIYSLQHHAIVGTHFEQLANWGLWAMAIFPPGPSRGAVLRVIVAHHLGAAGFLKGRVGGISWANPLTMLEMCKEFAPTAAVLDFVSTGPRTLISMLGWGGLLSEAIIFPAAVILVRDRTSAFYVVVALTAFHAGALVLVSMFFVHNIPIYAAALLLDTPKTSMPPEAWALIGFLSMITLFAIEDWPFSHMGLFPYSGAQLVDFKNRFGGSLRLIAAAHGAENFEGKQIRDSGAVDVIAWALHASVPTCSTQWEGGGRFGVATFWAKAWFSLHEIDLAKEPFGAVTAALRSIGKKNLLWDTTVNAPISNFFVVKLKDGTGDEFVIHEVLADSTKIDQCDGSSVEKPKKS